MTFSDLDSFIPARFADAKRTEAYGYIFLLS